MNFYALKLDCWKNIRKGDKNMNKNVIYVYRKDDITHSRMYVGSITRESNAYKFKYSDEYIESDVFIPIFPFLNKNKVYSNPNLFPVFASRLPDPKRVDIKNILSKYNLTEYDSFDLLRESQGRLPIDTLEFVSKLSEEDADGHTFLVSGTRHYVACSKKKTHIKLKESDVLTLVHDAENKYDNYAVKILFNNDTIGYVPVYYSKTYAQLLEKGYSLTATVLSVKECTCDEPNSSDCTDCISIKVSVNVKK